MISLYLGNELILIDWFPQKIITTLKTKGLLTELSLGWYSMKVELHLTTEKESNQISENW